MIKQIIINFRGFRKDIYDFKRNTFLKKFDFLFLFLKYIFLFYIFQLHLMWIILE